MPKGEAFLEGEASIMEKLGGFKKEGGGASGKREKNISGKVPFPVQKGRSVATGRFS